MLWNCIYFFTIWQSHWYFSIVLYFSRTTSSGARPILSKRIFDQFWIKANADKTKNQYIAHSEYYDSVVGRNEIFWDTSSWCMSMKLVKQSDDDEVAWNRWKGKVVGKDETKRLERNPLVSNGCWEIRMTSGKDLDEMWWIWCEW